MIGRFLCDRGLHRRAVHIAPALHPVLTYVYCRRRGCRWVQS